MWLFIPYEPVNEPHQQAFWSRTREDCPQALADKSFFDNEMFWV